VGKYSSLWQHEWLGVSISGIKRLIKRHSIPLCKRNVAFIILKGLIQENEMGAWY
jgi:hypothetical protein